LLIDSVNYECTTPHSPDWGDEELAAGTSMVGKKNQGSLRNNY